MFFGIQKKNMFHAFILLKGADPCGATAPYNSSQHFESCEMGGGGLELYTPAPAPAGILRGIQQFRISNIKMGEKTNYWGENSQHGPLELV